MRHRPPAVALGVLLASGSIAATGVAFAQGAPGAQAASPQATVDRPNVSPGETLFVQGSGFPGNAMLLAQLCGNEGRRGSADCDQTTAINPVAAPDGLFSAVLTVGTPPTPCPCVVRVSSVSGGSTAVVPVTVNGVPTAEPGQLAQEFPDVKRQIRVEDVSLEGDGPWTSWFGAAPKRTLVFTVENIGNVAVTDPPIVLASGKGDNPTTIVEAPAIGVLQPGEKRRFEVPVELPVLAFGQYNVVGQINGFADPVAFTTDTTTYPWALILIPALGLLEFVLIRVRNVLRRRALAPAPAAPVVLALPSGAPAVAEAAAASMALASTHAGLEETIFVVLSETLRTLDERLGGRRLDDGQRRQLVDMVAADVTDAVGDAEDLPPDARQTLAGVLREELDRALANQGAERTLATSGSPAL